MGGLQQRHVNFTTTNDREGMSRHTCDTVCSTLVLSKFSIYPKRANGKCVGWNSVPLPSCDTMAEMVAKLFPKHFQCPFFTVTEVSKRERDGQIINRNCGGQFPNKMTEKDLVEVDYVLKCSKERMCERCQL